MNQTELLHAANQKVIALTEQLEKVQDFINNREMNIYMQVYTAAVEAGHKNPAHAADEAVKKFNAKFRKHEEKLNS